jgi:hypothetical protein
MECNVSTSPNTSATIALRLFMCLFAEFVIAKYKVDRTLITAKMASTLNDSRRLVTKVTSNDEPTAILLLLLLSGARRVAASIRFQTGRAWSALISQFTGP